MQSHPLIVQQQCTIILLVHPAPFFPQRTPSTLQVGTFLHHRRSAQNLTKGKLSLSETFVRRNVFSSSFGSCNSDDVTRSRCVAQCVAARDIKGKIGCVRCKLYVLNETADIPELRCSWWEWLELVYTVEVTCHDTRREQRHDILYRHNAWQSTRPQVNSSPRVRVRPGLRQRLALELRAGARVRLAWGRANQRRADLKTSWQ